MIRFFTKDAVGELYGTDKNKLVPFECIKQWIDIKARFIWLWSDQILREHIITAMELYVPQSELTKPGCFKIYIGSTMDGQMMFIPSERVHEILDQIKSK